MNAVLFMVEKERKLGMNDRTSGVADHFVKHTH
jgi:hypothetical protein